MTITLTDPKTKNKLILSVFEASFSSWTRSSFGRDHNSHGYCSDEATTLWPLQRPIKQALVAALARVKKDEEVASSAHAARARVADMVRKTVKEG